MVDSLSEGAAGVREGDILAGKYRIDKVLGVGGMGVVVAAHHIQLDERVAIKFLLPEALGNAEAVARFAREARAAVKIKSEHVARVIDVGTLETGAPYMVMEYLDGSDLGAWVRLSGALPFEQTVEFILHASEAIAEAHALGIVHRDLKPANLFVIRRADGVLSVKVLDFGISKVTNLGASGPDMGMTKTSAVMGSPHYMSPEQVQSSRDVDARTDIWALGVILYELLTGRVPFDGQGFGDLVLRIVTTPPESIRSLRPDVPVGLEAVALRCLEKDRTRRYANVAELAVDLAPFGPKRARASVERISRVIQIAGLSASALVLPPSTEPTAQAAAAGTMASWGQTSPSTKRRGSFVAAGVAVLLFGGAGIALFRNSGRPHETPSTSPELAISVPTPAAQPVGGEKLGAEPVPVAGDAATSSSASAALPSTNAIEATPASSNRPGPRPVSRAPGRPTIATGGKATANPTAAAAANPPTPASPKNPFNVQLK
jgi:serine/threonine-protein kinase